MAKFATFASSVYGSVSVNADQVLFVAPWGNGEAQINFVPGGEGSFKILIVDHSPDEVVSALQGTE